MSLDEKQKDIKLSDIYLSDGICRSKSFAGLSNKQTHCADVTFSSSDLNFDTFSSSSLQNSLGAVFRQSSSLSSARNFIHALSASKSGKIRKSPHPQQAQTIFDAVSKGLRDSIHLAQNDISTSRMAFDNVSVSSVMSQGRLYELEKQMKANERLLKKLEFHLSKVEELKEQYDVQYKMRDGIRSMAYAYILSPGKAKDTALQNVKVQFKECTDILCSLESTLESFMGTLLFEMKGIQGFARICCGDIFEVLLKHGDQKWKSRGRVLKNGEQLWENKFMLFKAHFSEQLSIKAVEVRGLGKNIVLGNKFCEIHDLFCAHPQQMTINLNPSGSLKLNLVITWNPLNCSGDGVYVSTLSSSLGLPHSFRRNSISQSSIQEVGNISDSLGKETFVRNVKHFDNTGPCLSSKNTSASASAQSSAIASPDVEVRSKISIDDNSFDIDSNEESISSLVWLQDANCNNANPWSSVPTVEVNSEEKLSSSLSSGIVNSKKNNLEEVLKNVLRIVKSVTESYPEVNEILTTIEEIDHLLKVKRVDDSSDSNSNISISIESALGCFDFLNTAIETEDFDNSDKLSEDASNIPDQSMDVHIGIEDIQKDSISSNCFYSSGNEEVDVVLTDHLLYCTKLISSLVANCAMKHLANFILKKLQRQKSYLSLLLQILERNNQYHIDDFFAEEEYSIRDLWTTVAGSALYSLACDLYREMKKVIEKKVELESYMASIVCQRLIVSILDSDEFLPSSIITVFQFKLFFNNNSNPYNLLCEFSADTIAAEDLKCRDVQKAFAAVSILSKITPSSYSLFLIGCLLTEKNSDLKNIASCYLKTVGSNPDQRTKIILSYTEMLLSESVTPRLIACAALDTLDAKSSHKQLSLIADIDENSDVRHAASSVSSRLEKLSVEESLY